MNELGQRRLPIRSDALRRAAAGQPCALALPNICSHDPATVVLAHIRDESFGRSVKADDTSGMHCCHLCHRAYDLNTHGLEPADLLKLVLRAYQRTIRNLVERGIILVKLDAPAAKPVKPRKPKEQRAKIPAGRPLQSNNSFPPGRKIQSRKISNANPQHGDQNGETET